MSDRVLLFTRIWSDRQSTEVCSRVGFLGVLRALCRRDYIVVSRFFSWFFSVLGLFVTVAVQRSYWKDSSFESPNIANVNMIDLVQLHSRVRPITTIGNKIHVHVLTIRVVCVYMATDIFFRHDSRVLPMPRPSNVTCLAPLTIHQSQLGRANSVDGLVIVCHHCRHDQRLHFNLSINHQHHSTVWLAF